MRLRCFIACIVLFAACTKKETINNIDHINYVDEGNPIPHYEGVTTIQVENYINKLYIDLLGREPSVAERDAAVQALKATNLSVSEREGMIADLQENPEYYDQFSKIYMNALMGGFDSLRIQDEIDFLQFLVTSYTQAGQTQLAQFYEYEWVKLKNTNDAIYDYERGAISINTYFARLIHNYIYDQINMGSLNFCIASFEGLLHRLPTDEEETASVAMVDGVPSYLFLQDGDSKGDFVRILTQSDGFYEGLVLNIYQQLLARNPSSIEMNERTIALRNATQTFQEVQREVAASDEYAGF